MKLKNIVLLVVLTTILLTVASYATNIINETFIIPIPGISVTVSDENCPLFRVEQPDNNIVIVSPAPTVNTTVTIDYYFTPAFTFTDVSADNFNNYWSGGEFIEKYDEEYGLLDNPLKLLTNSASTFFVAVDPDSIDLFHFDHAV